MYTIKTPNMELIKPQTKVRIRFKQNSYNLNDNIIVTQQSLPPIKTQTFYPFADVSKKFEESLEKCRRKQKHAMKIKAIEQVTISKHLSENIMKNYRKSQQKTVATKMRERSSSETNELVCMRNNRRASELVDQLLLDIYGRGHNGKMFETEYGSSTSFKSFYDKYDENLQYSRLISKNVTELEILIDSLQERVKYSGNLLVKQLKKRDALRSKQEKICNVITAHLHAHSEKKSEDTNMRFSPAPVPGDSGFNQWRDAMKMVAKLPGGIPPEFRKKLWIALADKHLQSKGVNWNQTEKLCFNEWSNPDDSELGIQIVKDLHRTGCSLFCGAAGQENQALLKRVLLAYARWNKSVGYCQGFNMLAALILQVMDKSETDSVKVMIYLIEGVLPESYFANNLRGLSVDMIVFRDLLKLRLPQLSKHLEALQNDAREGNSYEPPLTNVFTMQWFLTLFCNCLPQPTVLRVWDLIFLEGNEILLRTAIAIWQKLSDRILAVNSADEFYSIMGVLTREMLEFGVVDSNTLIKSIVAIGTCSELNEMRDKYLYNITPWTQSVQSAAKKGFKMFYSDDDDIDSDYDEKAAVTAAYGISVGRRKEKSLSNSSSTSMIQPYAHGHPDRERLALDISALKKQYAKLRERQRQAHIILQAACARQPISQNPSPQPITMNHLLLGKNAIVNSRGRRLGPLKGSIPPARTKEPTKKKQEVSGETILWKDTAKIRYPRRPSCTEEPEDRFEVIEDDSSSSYSEDDASSTSTELCDEPEKINDFDLEDKFSENKEKSDEVSSKEDKNINFKPSKDIDCKNFDLETSETNNVRLEKFSLQKLKEMLEKSKVPSNTSTTTFSNDVEDIIEDENFTDIATSEPKTNFQDFTEEICCLSSSFSKISDDFQESHSEVFDYSKLCSNDEFTSKTEESKTINETSTADNETNQEFESFLKERIQISKENSVESLSSPKEDRLRRYKSYEETSSNQLEKSVIFKQKSFEIGSLPTIETSLWEPVEIEEEPRRNFKKQPTIDLLSVEDKRLEAGRRNSERALKIIQENSLILHRILQQQKSSEKEDSEDELSRSPISRTFLRSESLLSKDEKTDEERSSKDGDEELESGVESFSVSPALIEEESDKGNENIEYSYNLPSLNEEMNEFDSSLTNFSAEKHNSTEIIFDEKKNYVPFSYKYSDESNCSSNKQELISFFERPFESESEIKIDDSASKEKYDLQDYYLELPKSDSADNSFNYKIKDNEINFKQEVDIDDEKYSTDEMNYTPYKFNFSTENDLNEDKLSPYRKEHDEGSFKYSTFSPTTDVKDDEEKDELNFKLNMLPTSENKNLNKSSEVSSELKYSTFSSTTDVKDVEQKDELNFRLNMLPTSENKSLNKSSEVSSELKYSTFSSTTDVKDIEQKEELNFRLNMLPTSENKSLYKSSEVGSELKYSTFSPTKDVEQKDEFNFRLNMLPTSENKNLNKSSEVSSELKYSTFSSTTDVKDVEQKDELNFRLNTSETSKNKSFDESPEVSSEYVIPTSKFFESDNNSSENHESSAHITKESSDYKYNRKDLTINLKQSQYGEYSPEISPPKHLSCLQFTTFQADIPCTSKSIQLTPICAKDKTVSPCNSSPSKSPVYFSSFNLPTLSPPRRSVKSPFSPDKTFNPFPVQPTTRQPKEVGVRLGLYKNSSPQKSPNK